MRFGTVFYSCDFHGPGPTPMRVVAVEFEATMREALAPDGQDLESFESRAWGRLFEIAGQPPPGYSSWLGGNRYYRL